MNALYPSDWRAYLEILQVFLRALGLFLLVPGFSHNAIPTHFKVLFAMALSLVIFPIVRPYLMPIDNSIGTLAFVAMRETVIGFCMGFVCYLLCEGIHLAAQFVGYQMGFGTAGLLEPQSQSSVSVMVHLQTWLVFVLFFVTDMHHQVIQIFVMSFSVTKQLESASLVNLDGLKIVVEVSARMFSLAVQLAAPFTVLILLCNMMIAMLSRMLPQMNILLFAFPVTIFVGFATFYVVAPELLEAIESVLGDMSTTMMAMVRTL